LLSWYSVLKRTLLVQCHSVSSAKPGALSTAAPIRITLFAALIFLSNAAPAAVLPKDAEMLKSVLTPVGAERAGNADGSIPAWTGREALPGADEKPILVITAETWRRYESRLPEGQKALFAKYPDYRMEIYPTHRTAALPEQVYRDIFANATRAHAGKDGIAAGIEGAAGGVPFPIPQNGTEAVWNHLLAFWGPAREDRVRNYFMAADGTLTLTNQYREIVDFPYYAPGATPGSIGDFYYKRREISDGPPSLAGRGYLLWQPLDQAHAAVQAWQYLPREHRVRKSPLLSHDTPTPDGAGIESFDDYYVFSGSPDRYAFTLVGKTEMYVPYNNNRFYQRPVSALAGPKHLVPDALRYELHRVWVVDGVLASGQHHLVPHRRLYLDEDSWFAVYADGWDAEGRLWKFSHGTMPLMPDLPAVVLGSQVTYDLQAGGYFVGFTFNEEPAGFKPTAPHDASVFTPEALASQAATN
jgi:hypothetical protein